MYKYLSVILFFMVSCGLPFYIYLNEPLSTVPSPSSFVLVTSKQDRTDLPGGIELYYKMYADTNHEDNYDNDYDSVFDGSISSIISNLASRGFYRVTKDGDDEGIYSYPLLPLSADDLTQSLRFEIDFSTDDPNILQNGEYIYLHRDVYNNDDREFKDFGDFDDLNDKDLTQLKTNNDSYYYICMFALTYANYNFESVYSNIAKLGCIYKNK